MSNYQRTTRECSVRQLHPELRQAVQSYFQEHDLGDPETESLMCCETISEKKKVSKLDSWLGEPDTTVHMGMLFTSELLIWVRRGKKSGTILNVANLNAIQVKAYQSILTKETGLEIFGLISSSKGLVNGFIGMGEEEAAQKFCEAVQKAIPKVDPPARKGLLSQWLSPRE